MLKEQGRDLIKEATVLVRGQPSTQNKLKGQLPGNRRDLAKDHRKAKEKEAVDEEVPKETEAEQDPQLQAAEKPLENAHHFGCARTRKHRTPDHQMWMMERKFLPMSGLNTRD